MKILKEETFRSKPLVNMTDDMVRVTIQLTRNEWRQAKRDVLKAIHKVRTAIMK